MASDMTRPQIIRDIIGRADRTPIATFDHKGFPS